MPLHQWNQLTVERRLKLVFRDFLNAINQASTRGAIDKCLSIDLTDLEVGDDVGPTDPDGEARRARGGGNRLVMNGEMTGNESRTLRHRTHHSYKKLKTRENVREFNKL